MTKFQNLLKAALLCLVLISTGAMSQTPCENGMSDSLYPCSNIEMLSRTSAVELLAENTGGVWLNDIWGWTDPTSGKEYALVAMSNGTSFVDVSDPLKPIVLGILPEHASASSGGRAAQANSIWRDVKVFNDHAFIVSEDPNHGMQVFDLARLRNVSNPPETFPEDAHYDGISDAHNIVINEATGFAYIVGATLGSTCNAGGLHIVDINDPLNPTYVGCFDQDGYTHDAQCIIYDGPDSDYTGREICFNSNEDAFTIADVTDKSNTSMIVTRTYAGVRYAHQGWLSEDRKYFYSNDELDELNNGTDTKTLIWDVQDLDNPVLIDTYTHEGKSIDHNLYVKGNLIYESNYSRGLRILDSENLLTTGLEEIAFFDTFYQDNGTNFSGNWSNYPYFASGNIIVSDITNGLFVLRYTPDVQPPAVPSNLSANSVTANSFILNWTAPDVDDLAGYNIYLHNNNGSPFATTTETTFTFNGLNPEIEYTVLIEAFDKSGNISDPISLKVTTTLILSISDLDAQLVKLYPNPASDYAILDLVQLPFTQANLEIYDFSGKKVSVVSLDLTVEKEVTLNTSSLKKGLYHIKVTNGSDRYTQKLRIQ